MSEKMNLEKLDLLSMIGRGAYAKVMLVRNKDNPTQFYAMKILDKGELKKRKQGFHVMMERNILVGIDHPFVVKLHSSFQNEAKLYFLLEYCPGGDLFSRKIKQKRLPEHV